MLLSSMDSTGSWGREANSYIRPDSKLRYKLPSRVTRSHTIQQRPMAQFHPHLHHCVGNPCIAAVLFVLSLVLDMQIRDQGMYKVLV